MNRSRHVGSKLILAFIMASPILPTLSATLHVSGETVNGDATLVVDGIEAEPGSRLSGEGVTLSPGGRIDLTSEGVYTQTVSLASSGAVAFGTEASLDLDSGKVGIFALETDEQPTLVFRNVRLAEYDIAYACTSNFWQFCDGGKIAYPFVVERTENSIKAQMQLDTQSGNGVKCVCVKLEQQGADVVGRTLWASWNNGHSYLDYGADQEALIAAGTGADPDPRYNRCKRDGGGYQLDSIVLRRRPEFNRHVVTKPVTASGVTIEKGIELSFNGSAVSPETAWPALTVQDGGRASFENTGSQTLTKAIGGGTATMRFLSTQGERKLRYQKQSSADWVNLFQDAALASVTGLVAKANGLHMDPQYMDNNGICRVYFWENRGSYASCQLQIVDWAWDKSVTYLKGMFFELRQNGRNIQGRIHQAGYVEKTNWPDQFPDGYGYRFTFDGSNPNEKNGQAGWGYGFDDMTLYGARTLDVTTLANDAAVSLRGGTFEVSGYLRIEQKRGLPLNGFVRVSDGGVLDLATEGDTWYQGIRDGTTELDIGTGASLLMSAANCLGARTKQRVVVNGGTVVYDASVSNVESAPANGSTYVNNLTLKNGAAVKGLTKVLVGNQCDVAEWTVGGDTPSFCEAPLALMGGYSSGEKKFVLDVADVTQSAAADFTFTRELGSYDANYRYLRFVKKGDGTVAQAAPMTCLLVYPLRIEAGSWRVETDDAFPSGQAIELASATLGFAAGTDNTISSLTVSGPCTIKLAGDGTSVNIAALAFGENGELSISGSLRRSSAVLRCPTLTREQLGRISCEGRPVAQRSDGTLRLDVGLVIEVR